MIRSRSARNRENVTEKCTTLQVANFGHFKTDCARYGPWEFTFLLHTPRELTREK